MSLKDTPAPDIVTEARRLVGAAAEQHVPVRLLGGLAIRLHSSESMSYPALVREPKDIDFVAPRAQGRQAADFLEEMGYEPNRAFNALNSGRRALFYDTRNDRQLDLFVGAFAMCHTIPIVDRIELDPITVPLAELLLTKLQVIELNDKDQRDILTLLLEHQVGDADNEMINCMYVARLCASDWGLWRTAKLNIERTRKAIGAYAFASSDRELLLGRVDALWAAIDAAPKSRRWKVRDRVGDRVRWYEEPEEVG